MDEKLLQWIEDLNLPSPQKEYRPGTAKKFRLDYAWTDVKIAVELNGATWSQKRMGHSSGKGIQRDYVKLNYCQILGWLVIQFDSSMGELYCKEVLTKAFRSRGVEI